MDVRFETVTVDDLLVSTSGASLRLVIDLRPPNPCLPSTTNPTLGATATIANVDGQRNGH